MGTPPNPPLLEHGDLVAYLRPPQTNGAEHYDVALRGLMAGRVTRRAAPHNERPTPGWYVWNAWESSAGSGYVLRDGGNNVIYYPEPADALRALHSAIYPDADNLPCGCTPHKTRTSRFGTAVYCETEQQPYCNFECPHEEEGK